MPKAKANIKEVDAVPYEVPALVLTPEKPMAVTGNFEVVEKTLEKWAAKVSKMELTEDNLSEVQQIKRAAVALRNQLDAKVDATKKLFFNDPKKIFEARTKALYDYIAKVEDKTDEILDKLEQERIDGINEILNHYKAKFQEQYKLDEEKFLSRIEYKKNYYNKGMEEKARKDDLEQQFIDLAKEQKAYDANVRLISASCKNDPRLNVKRYISDLDTSDVASVVEAIEEEKKRLREIDNQETTTETASTSVECDVVDAKDISTEETEKIILGVPNTISFLSDFPTRTKSMKIEITYPCDLGDSLKKLFESLKQHNIKIKPIKSVEVAF